METINENVERILDLASDRVLRKLELEKVLEYFKKNEGQKEIIIKQISNYLSNLETPDDEMDLSEMLKDLDRASERDYFSNIYLSEKEERRIANLFCQRGIEMAEEGIEKFPDESDFENYLESFKKKEKILNSAIRYWFK